MDVLLSCVLRTMTVHLLSYVSEKDHEDWSANLFFFFFNHQGCLLWAEYNYPWNAVVQDRRKAFMKEEKELGSPGMSSEMSPLLIWPVFREALSAMTW